jgi:hypothetical protein
MEIELDPRRVAKTFVYIVLVLLLLNSVLLALYFAFPDSNIYVLSDYFDFGVEANIPTFYSAVALLVCAGVLAVIARRQQAIGGGHPSYWLGLAIIFVYLALDEATEIHEWASNIMDRFIVGEGLLYYLWVLPYAAIALVIGLVYLRFLWSLPVVTRWQFIAAGTIYLLGVLGFEMLGARVADEYGTTDTVTYSVLYTIEETLEMLGIVFFLYALLRYLAATTGVVTIRLISPPRAAVTEHKHAEDV